MALSLLSPIPSSASLSAFPAPKNASFLSSIYSLYHPKGTLGSSRTATSFFGGFRGSARIESTAADKKRQMVSRNGEFDEGEIERIGGQDEDDEELVEGHDDNSPSSPDRWDVLGLGQAMVSLSLSLSLLPTYH